MEINANKNNVKSLFGGADVQVRVPPFQRPYSWTADQVDDLLTDIFQAVEKGSGVHFMGAIVLNDEDETTPEIVDGQQRIATLFILLATIRDIFAERGEEAQVGRLQGLYIENDYAQSGRQFRFEASQANAKVFRNFVLASSITTGRREWAEYKTYFNRTEQARNKNVYRNSERIKFVIYERLLKVEESVRSKWLDDLVKTVVSRLEFVVVRVKNLDDAFSIFETLNDRGLELSAGDLLKNETLKQAAQSGLMIESFSKEWDEIVDSLGGSDLTKFLRHYLLVFSAGLTKQDVLPEFRKMLSKMGPESFVKELQDSARIYGLLLDPSKSSWTKEIRYGLENLKLLRVAICYAALLPARKVLNDTDFARYLKTVETLTFRYSSVCDKGSNTLEVTYHESAKILATSGASDLTRAIRILQESSPSPEEFRASFLDQGMGSPGTVKYLLREVERHLVGDEKELNEPKRLNIEHIMPESPDDEWGFGELPDGYSEQVNKWGNLTLLAERLNKKGSNQVFSKKKPFYEKSQIELTKQLCLKDSWGPDDIRSRQEWLLAQAEEIWSFPIAETTIA